MKPARSPKAAEWRWQGWLMGLLLAVGAFIAYLPALHGQFVWDDDWWTTRLANVMHDGAGLCSMWSKLSVLQQYYPLTGTTFWLDYQFWGFNTLPYHLENVLLHAAAALLFWRLLERLQTPAAWLAAAIFAVHPVMVESAAWITERKNVLSLVLFLGALLAYGCFARFWRPPAENSTAGLCGAAQGSAPVVCFSSRWFAYGLALVLFVAALLAKTTAFSLPAVVLLLCWWKRGHIRWRQDIVPTVPFFAIAVGFGLVTRWVEAHQVGAAGSDFAFTFPERCLIAGRALWFYAGKLLWPVNLCFIYPHWHLDARSFWQWLYPASAAAIMLALWLWRARLGRGPVVAALFFAGTLFPVLGFMNAYFMRYSFVCDHWVYLSSLGIIALGAAVLARAAALLRVPAALYGFATVILPLLAVLTWQQSAMYTNIETLWLTTIDRNPAAFLAHNNLGVGLAATGRVEEAIDHYRKALEIRPDYAESHNNLGNALLRQGRLDEAIVHLRKAHDGQSGDAVVCNNLGNALLQNGQLDKAMPLFLEAIQIQPAYPEALNNMGVALLRKGKSEEAGGYFQRALRNRPGYSEAWSNLGAAFAMEGKLSEAVEPYQNAIQLKPDYPDAEGNLAKVLAALGRLDEAVAHYRRTLELMPDSVQGHFRLGQAFLSQRNFAAARAEYEQTLNLDAGHVPAHSGLAWLLATCPVPTLRDGPRAVLLARRAQQLAVDDSPELFDVLAAAYAESGQFTEAVAAAQKALTLAIAQANQPLADAIRPRLSLYQAGSPFRDSAGP